MGRGRLIALVLLGVTISVAAGGCFSTGCSYLLPGESLVDDLTDPKPPPLTRLQQADSPVVQPPVLQPPVLQPPVLQPPVVPAPTLPSSPPPDNPLPKNPPTAAPRPPAPIPEVQQTTLKGSRNLRVSVRAWVNGRPLFDGEVMQILQARKGWFDVQRLPEPQRSEQMATAYNEALDTVIEQEVMYQDAVRKLEKNNPRAMEKLRQAAAAEFEKDLKRIRDTGQVSDAELKEFEITMRRHMERSFVSMEYARSRIYPIMSSRIGPEEIREYYDTHKNEFQKVDRVEWQDIFIAVGPKLPTPADARRFAEDLIAQCRTADDFAKLLRFDDGDSKFRNGLGMGTRRGEIRPAEVEDALFRLKEGQIGPVVELSTGAHIIRVLKREYAGPIPLNEATQNQIRGKLRSLLADRMYRSIVRELMARAVIERVAER